MSGLLTRLAEAWAAAWGPPAAQAAVSAEPAARPEPAEIGVTGTPIFSGFLRDLGEYNPDLVGLSAYRVYEQMRRSDAQVAATVYAMKLAIRGAEWAVAPPENASPKETEAADFVRSCLFESIDFDAAIENALLMLDFGASAHEDVYAVDGDRVRLKKLAPRLPLTFYRWLTEPDGETLAALQQYGYRGSQFVIATVPANKIALFTHQQEGANFAGRSVMRPMYQHWYIKSNLYKIDAIAQERNGMGIPWISMGPDVKKEDRDTAIKWLQQLSVHEKAAILLPAEWKFGLQGVQGLLVNPKESIAHHNMQISMAGLSQFMLLGQGASRGGNRSLGETQSDFFYLSLQAVAKRIERTFTLSTVRRIVDFNFAGIEDGRYPALKAQKLLSLRFEAVVDALSKLANANVGAIVPDEDLQAWLRKDMGAPEANRAKLLPRPGGGGISLPPGPPEAPGGRAPAAAGASGTGGAGTPPPPPPESPHGPENPASGDSNPPARAEAGEEGGGAKLQRQGAAAGVPGRRPSLGGAPIRLTFADAPVSRAPVGAEVFLALAEITSQLDRGRDEIAAALRRARPRVQAEIIHKLVGAPVRTMHRVSVAPDQKLLDEIESVLHTVYQFGFEQVGQERDRQRAGKPPESASQIRAADKRDPLGLYADAAVAEFTNNLTQRATNVTLDLKRKADLTTGEIIQQAGQTLDEQSDRWIDAVGSKAANNAFADGRSDAYEQYKDEIERVIYSALLDINTCEACADADGQEGETEDDVPDVPNPDCDGGDRCRCVHVYVFSDEGQAAMSWELANEEKSLGQFASNRGYADLIAAAKGKPALEELFDQGISRDVASCIAELEAISGDESVRSTAARLAALMRGQAVAVITDGLTEEP